MILNLTDEYWIERTKWGFDLNYKSKIGVNKTFKGENIVSFPSYTKHYGVLYQALQGFLICYIEDESHSLDQVVNNVEEAMRIIDEATKNLSEEFKIVKVSNGS